MENKKMNKQKSAYSVAVAKASFNRKKMKVNSNPDFKNLFHGKFFQAEQEISMDTLDASNQSIRYIDQDEDGSDPNTSTEQSITTREDIPDLNNAENKRRTFKKMKGLSVAQKKFWQETLEIEDELDGTSIINKTFNSVRMSSPDDSDTLVTKVVRLDKKKLKERRNDRYRTEDSVYPKNIYSISRKNVRVADLTIQDDQEYFSEFVTMRSV